MKYLIQIYGNVTREQVAAMSDDERKQLYEAWGAIRDVPGLTPGPEMDAPATAKTVRVKDGKPVTTDGPFVETKEALGGYFIFEAADIDAAVEFAARVPTASRGGAIEVRPLVER